MQVLESLQPVQLPFATIGQVASQPFVAFESSLKLLLLQVTAVHVDESEHAVQVPPVATGQSAKMRAWPALYPPPPFQGAPIVSISVGLEAVYLIGGESKEQRPHAILLRSGDVVLQASSVPAR